MGYTHYWRRLRDFTDAEWKVICAAARIVTDKHKDILCYEYDEVGKAPEISGTMIRFNGKGEDGHETFYFTKAKGSKPAWISQTEYDTQGVFHFCKTARKPYDEAVVMLLAAIKKIAPDALTISSDGDNVFRVKGLAALVREAKAAKPKARAKKSHPATVRPGEYAVELPTGCKLVCPAHPKPCEYVRIVDPMCGEVAYWDSEEWREAPQEVMGAIMGALSSGNEDA
jgi:hypothetical protein